MKTSDNTIQLIGRPGTEPIIKQFDNNGLVARFSFATSEQTTDEEGKSSRITRWHKIVAWGKNAALVQQKVRKGAKMSIVGKACVRQYADKDGVLKEVNEIQLYNLSLLQNEPA